MGSVPSASSFGLEALLEILRFGYEVETTARRTVVTAVDIGLEESPACGAGRLGLGSNAADGSITKRTRLFIHIL